MGYLHYKGYTGSVEYSDEDNCLYGKVLGLSKNCITYEGTTLDELRTDFEAGINDYLNYCEASGIEPAKPYSGTLNLRIPPEIHNKIAFLAAQKGVSINTVIKQTLETAYSK
jgi:predicted HicB family RNase H-like nuclease